MIYRSEFKTLDYEVIEFTFCNETQRINNCEGSNSFIMKNSLRIGFGSFTIIAWVGDLGFSLFFDNTEAFIFKVNKPIKINIEFCQEVQRLLDEKTVDILRFLKEEINRQSDHLKNQLKYLEDKKNKFDDRYQKHLLLL